MASVTELEARAGEIRTELLGIDTEYDGAPFPEEVKGRWNELNGELDEIRTTVKELEARTARLAELEGRDANREIERDYTRRVSTKASRVPENVFAIEEYRNLSDNDEQLGQAYRDGAMKVIEHATFPHPEANREDQQEHIQRLLDTVDQRHGDDGPRSFARRILHTASPGYLRAWSKHIAGHGLTMEEQRNLGIGTQGGGYPVPIVLDPTVILTSNGQVNPMRQISRVENIVGNTWNGVASTGITAGYSAEFTETTDNSPTLTQPKLNVEKAQALVPFSIEAGEDWGSLQSEMARLLQDAKDALESTKFLAGAGHASNEPSGLLVGATTAINTAATTTFAVADLYSLLEALPPRWQPNATFVANLKYLNKIRQFDTAGGASLWTRLPDGLPPQLLMLPVHQYSAMTTAGTSGASIVTIGDFSQYLIAERIGLNIEIIPHLTGTVANLPTGTRGLYAYWRNSGTVLTIPAFRTLKLL